MENKELVRVVFDRVFTNRDLAACDDVFATDYVEHAVTPFGSEAPGAVHGPDHMRNVVTYLVDQYPDLVMTIESIVSEGDTVAVRVFSQGTNLGKLQGVMPPTGKKFSGRQIHWYRVVGGKLAEHWAVREDLETMLQLGVVQRPR
jgi:predicted ester cyclase